MSIQFDMRRLLSENAEHNVVFVVLNNQLESLLKTYFSNHLDSLDHNKFALDREIYDRFCDLAMSSEYIEGDDKDFYRVDEIDEMDGGGSTTPAAGAYLPSLHASPKKYKGPELKKEGDTEPKLAAGKAKVYMKNKWGWKDAPSIPNRPSKGGFIYKKIFERDKTKDKNSKGEDLKIGDNVIIDKSVNSSWDKDGFGQIVSFVGDQAVVYITTGGESTFPRQMTVNKDKLSLQSGEIDNQEKEDMEKEPMKEGFKRDIKVRNESQQLREAMKLVRKKLKEVNHILEYSKELKGLQENECESCSRMMESMKQSIAEAYKKMKEL